MLVVFLLLLLWHANIFYIFFLFYRVGSILLLYIIFPCQCVHYIRLCFWLKSGCIYIKRCRAHFNTRANFPYTFSYTSATVHVIKVLFVLSFGKPIEMDIFKMLAMHSELSTYFSRAWNMQLS
jgi:hypothetical protein